MNTINEICPAGNIIDKDNSVIIYSNGLSDNDCEPEIIDKDLSSVSDIQLEEEVTVENGNNENIIMQNERK